ncbi:MAG: hypothetical protein ACJKTH_00960 [Patescibacteria group bacterium UBA2163]
MALIPTAQQIKEAYSKTSPLVQQYMNSEEYIDAFSAFRTKHNLHFDELGNIANAVEAVFLGLVPTARFSEMLQEALEQNSALYSVVLNDVNNMLFKPFRVYLDEKRKQLEEKKQEKPVPAQPLEPSQDNTPAQPKVADEKISTFTEPTLGTSRREKLEEVEVDAFSEEDGSPQPKTQYKTVDPYREPIE